MIDYKYFDLFQHSSGSVDKDWKIEYDGGSFTDWDMESESIELSESLCSETELRFGRCEASCLKFTVVNIVKPLINEWITLSVAINHHDDEPLVIGRYKVNSEKLTADKQYKEIIAYDAMYDIINADVAAWYNSVLPNENSTMTLKQFRESFIRRFGLEEVVPEDGLVNDNMAVKRTVDPEQMSGLDVITAVCEINGCFGHIGRDGKFHYIYLQQAIEGLYPADNLYPDHAPEWMAQAKTGHLYPQDPKGTIIGSDDYIECHYEEYCARRITKLQIRKEENDIGSTWPAEDILESDNCYIIQDNFLVYGKTSEQLAVIAENIFGKITDIVYRPYDADVMGNPCFEVGDPVRFPTKYEIVESYILNRTLKGIQALRDDYSAEGVERYSEEVNGVHSSIIQLKGKSNVLTRTVEENRLEMLDIEKNLSLSISALAGQIVIKVNSNGEMALVQLKADPDTGTEFKVAANNISLTAEEVISFMSGGTLNITASDINIKSDKWTVDKNGNMECNNITAFQISGNAVNQFNSSVSDSEAMRVARQAISDAAGAAQKAQEAADIAIATVNNLVNTVIPDTNSSIMEVSGRVSSLESRVSALESR